MLLPYVYTQTPSKKMMYVCKKHDNWVQVATAFNFQLMNPINVKDVFMIMQKKFRDLILMMQNI